MSDKPMQATKNDLMQSALDHYDELATKANHWMSEIPKAIRAYYSERNQPPKSAEEKLRQAFRNNSDCYADTWHYKGDILTEGEVVQAMTEDAVVKLFTEMNQFARYVPDEEIDAMWPDMYGFDMAKTLVQREAAKAMRDKIFNNVKLKV